jgi:hypothetical protein
LVVFASASKKKKIYIENLKKSPTLRHAYPPPQPRRERRERDWKRSPKDLPLCPPMINLDSPAETDGNPVIVGIPSLKVQLSREGFV